MDVISTEGVAPVTAPVARNTVMPLRPSWAGLAALTADRPTRSAVRDDPALVVHFLRFGNPAAHSLRALAAGLAAEPTPYLDWTTTSHGAAGCRFGRLAARVCASLAVEDNMSRPGRAWSAGLLAPLGLYAIAAGDSPSDDPAVMTRRVAARWRLPSWLGNVISWLHFSPTDAATLGADPRLFEIVQAGIAAVERALDRPGTLTGDGPTPHGSLSDRAAELAGRFLAEVPEIPPTPHTIPADAVAVMARLVAVLARSPAAGRVESRYETQIDALAGLVSAARREFDAAVHDARLSGLAEFAAGASHEINNPLMIIAGQAKKLAAGEADPARRSGFDAIGRSVRRIHELLNTTRQFARPSVPNSRRLDLAAWLTDSQPEFRDVAAESGAVFDLAIAESGPTSVFADPDQLRTVLANLIRNGADAAGRNGWVRATVSAAAGSVRIVIEDSGAGPDAGAVPHLFDPFFCGRPAGRRPGLGLPVAWRLAQENAGRLTYSPVPSSPGRFVLSFPSDAGRMGVDPARRSA